MLHILFSSELGYNLNHLGVLGTFWLKENALMFPIMLALLMISVFAGYLLGSINFAIITSKSMYDDDVRKYGSGNAGFTNMMRSFGMKASVITMLGDALKCIFSALIGWVLYGYMGAAIGALGCFFGHIYPLFFKFKGGKGVVCYAASFLALDWRLFLLFVLIFVVTVAITKYVSFASVLSSMVMPLFMSRMYNIITVENARLKAFCVMVAFIGALVVVLKHIGNIKRIFAGTERKFEFKKTKQKEENDD